MEFKKLFSSVKIGNLEIKNRFVVPPMGTNFANPDGTVTQTMIDYYTERAKGGYGLIYVEITAVESIGKAIMRQAGLWDDEQIKGFKELTSRVHEAGAKIFLQLHHAGRQTVPSYIGGNQPVAPSAVPCPRLNTLPRALSTEEVWDLVGKFGDAAVRAKKAGFDGVEIHGAHGYLIAQFMSSHANKRIDEFGGDFLNRMKFPLEIIKDVRRKVGQDYPVSFRFSYDEKVNGGRTIEESTMVARLVEQAGVDVLNVSIMTYASMQYMSAPPAVPNGFNQYATEIIKKCVSVPVIAVGRCTVPVAEDILLNERADLIAFGRESIAEPALPNKVKEGRMDEICPCIYCLQSCLGYLNNPERIQISCLANPVTGYEKEYDFSPVAQSKKVLIAGGGPAGLMAAWVAACRGHDVSLYEARSELGGQFRVAAIPPLKQEIIPLLKYYIRMGHKYGVKYQMNVAVTPELIRAESPDAVILATGGMPLRPASIPGIDAENIFSAFDVLNGQATVGNHVLVVGGGMTGAETADYLSELKKKVTIVEMREDIAIDVMPAPRIFLLERLMKYGIKFMVNTEIVQFTNDGASCICNGEAVELTGYDSIVLAMGVKSYNPLMDELKGLSEVYVIGDAGAPGKANTATEAGLKIGLAL